MNNTQKWMYTAFLIGIWTLMFDFVNRSVSLRISQKKLNDTKNRIVSMLHGFLAFWLSTITLLLQPNLNKYTRSIYRKNNAHTVDTLLMISLSYFIYDTFGCLYYNILDKAMLFHHLVCITVLTLCLFGFKGSFYLIMGLSLAQVSNFPMHLKLILQNMNLTYTKLYQLCENLYFFLYTIARGVISPIFLLIPVLISHKFHIGLKALVLAIHIQSFFVIYSFVEISRKNAQRRQEIARKGIDYHWFIQNPEKLRQLSFYREQEQ